MKIKPVNLFLSTFKNNYKKLFLIPIIVVGTLSFNTVVFGKECVQLKFTYEDKINSHGVPYQFEVKDKVAMWGDPCHGHSMHKGEIPDKHTICVKKGSTVQVGQSGTRRIDLFHEKVYGDTYIQCTREGKVVQPGAKGGSAHFKLVKCISLPAITSDPIACKPK